MLERVRGRFAPTPSGLLHIGNARTALAAWWHARQAGGDFVLRIEDIDAPRCRPEYAEQVLSDLRWLGIDWDEGPDVGGPVSPYRQQERLALYEAALRRLQADGRLYPCFCSRAELAAIASAPHGLAGEAVYPGICRQLTPAERAVRTRTKTPSLRFMMPDEDVEFRDDVMGPQRFAAPAGGDFIVRRADGVIAYQLAVVVDDAAMDITHVVRGADLLDSTPRQLALFRALDLPAPRYAHIPLLYGADGKRLAKRHGDITLAQFRQSGRGPEALIGWLAWWTGLLERPEPAQARELIPLFDLQRIPRDAVVVTERDLAAIHRAYGFRI